MGMYSQGALVQVDLTNPTSTPARNLSIWLLPAINSPEYQRIGEIINYLAHKYGNTPFPPHVTLSMLPVDFPLEVVRDVVEEMKEEWFSKWIEFETIFTTPVGIAVHGRRGNQSTVSESKRPWPDQVQIQVPTKKESIIERLVWHVTPSRTLPPAQEGMVVSRPDTHEQHARVGDGENNTAIAIAMLQQRFHDKLQEEVQKRRLAGTIAPDTPDVRNTVPWFPHLSLAYTERGQEEGIKEIAEKGWYTQSRPDEPVGIQLAGFKNYKIGAIFFAYCGGLKPEKWTIFERIEEATGANAPV
jgi:hypothetical protein